LQAKARQFTETTRIIEACRGKILDRNGRVLANSVPAKIIYANLALCSNRVEQIAQTCGPLLCIPPSELATRLRISLQKSADRGTGPPRALVLKRNVPVAEWQAISSALALESFGFRKPLLAPTEKAELQKLRHKLLFARDTQLRCYPYEETLSQVLGFVSAQTNGSGLQGVCGTERAFDKVLAGENGRCVSAQDAAGNELRLHRREYKLPADGANVVLTIDLRLQEIVEDALVAAMTKYRARGASAIVMNPRTFEILAVASLPTFNPQNPGASPAETWRSPAFSDRVEPGSTLKMITLAAALDQDVMTLDSGVYCEQGRYVVNHVTVRDHLPYGLQSLRQGFYRSSNIALVKTALELGPQRFYHYLTNFGLGRCTGIPVVGETAGWIGPPADWSTMKLTRAAFGQGVCVSQLQMAVATCVIANEGRLMRPLLVSRIVSPQGRVLQQFQPQFVRTVVRPQTALQVKEAMKAVVGPGGTGVLAAMDRYTVALKTGTAQKSNAQGYLRGRYYSSVIGFFPADAPQVVIAVALDEPQNGYYGGMVVAPVFRGIAEQIATCLSISPDKGGRAPARNLAAQPTPPADRLVHLAARGSSSMPALVIGRGSRLPPVASHSQETAGEKRAPLTEQFPPGKIPVAKQTFANFSRP
jgi:cell division protein FtsI (penicillin-binding protein 3)/stage V sporulation protein D (sporulation-specific penicillin-binding protein)